MCVLRSPIVANANNVRYVQGSGALNNNNAANAGGGVRCGLWIKRDLVGRYIIVTNAKFHTNERITFLMLIGHEIKIFVVKGEIWNKIY